MGLKLSQIVSALAELTPAERRTLHQTLEQVWKCNGNREPVDSKGTQNDWLLPGIERELQRRGLAYAPLRPERAKALVPGYPAEAALLCAKYKEQLRKTMPTYKHAHLLALGAELARVLADYLEPIAPIGLKLLLNNVNKLPEAIEASYPGYLGAGQIKMLIT